MPAFELGVQGRVIEQIKNKYVASVESSPSSRSSSSSDDVFSNGDARSSQSSAPSSVKGSPLTYDSEAPSDIDTFTVANHHLRESLSSSRTNISQHGFSSCTITSASRRHPRRTGFNSEQAEPHETAARKPIPTLIRQCDRKEQFVEALVDTTTEMIEVIWPLSVAQCSFSQGGKNILDLRKFVQEVLRRSKTSYSTLQVALFYLVLLIPYVPRPEVPERREDPPVCRALRCGRRMFLAALILASKYLQDRNYTMLAWAKISGLKKEEICFNELAFLRTVNYELHIPEQLFKDWADIVLKYSLEDECRRARSFNGGRCEKWRAIVPYLTRDLSSVSNQGSEMLANAASTPWAQQWTPPASPVSFPSPSRSESPATSTTFAKPPPPRFLEPRVMTTAELGLRSPKLSKLETPCLPPINLDCPPAVSGNRFQCAGRASAMGLAMKQAGAVVARRNCYDNWPVPSRVKGAPYSRRSCLSTASCSPKQSVECDVATWGNRSSENGKSVVAVSLDARESCVGAPSPSVLNCDETTFAARALQDISMASSGFPTPMSVNRTTDDSSSASPDTKEMSTPKGVDTAARPLVRTARKRERPTSSGDGERRAENLSCAMNGTTSIVRHAGGIPVDYGIGVDSCVGRSRHIRSSSGSCGGARKRSCITEKQSNAA